LGRRPPCGPTSPDLDAAHPALGRERNEAGAEFGQIAPSNAVLLLGEHDDGAAFRSLVRERGKLRGVRQLLFGHTAQGLNSAACRLPR